MMQMLAFQPLCKRLGGPVAGAGGILGLADLLVQLTSFWDSGKQAHCSPRRCSSCLAGSVVGLPLVSWSQLLGLGSLVENDHLLLHEGGPVASAGGVLGAAS